MKIVQIVGMGRSGSTILARALRSLTGFCAPGELYYVWQEGFLENRKCECGAEFSTCPFWTKVTDELRRSDVKLDPLAAERDRLRFTRTRRLLGLATPGGRKRLVAGAAAYIDSMASIDRAIGRVTQARVLVDASKIPTHALIMDEGSNCDQYILHLVRDPRGVANSWRRRRANPASGKPFGRMSVVKSTLLWVVWNVASELLLRRKDRYHRIRYEDWVSTPAGHLREIAAFVGEPSGAQATAESGLRLQADHSIGGNPNRFSAASARVRKDESWKSELGFRDRVVVIALAWPLMLRYGYLGGRGADRKLLGPSRHT